MQSGKALCEQLKSYLKFLKSMKVKMVVNVEGVDEARNF